ncbi:hypothetical protein EUGRSUZ_E03340 [Eucalyptus grandis]|uniref:Uncharacterized protein n=2 Tax=Eucalyptus grandis TaxID=71139 RepID=A0ACC3KZN9_EUCGR|nr:hypothetical protein EUGRSUZ_E03340 [Eucalyptus grandis]
MSPKSEPRIKWSNKITTSQVEQLVRAERDVQWAMLVFDSATAEHSNGFCHDEKTFTEKLLQRMKEQQCNLTEDIFLSICRGCGRVHGPLDSLRIFQTMNCFQCKPSPKSYVTILDMPVEENHMRVIGVSPIVASLNVLIKAFCKNSGTMDYIWKLFEEMETKGCSPSVITYTSTIDGLCQSENFDEAFGLFEQMVGKGIEPNVFTFSTLMDGFCKSGCSSQAMDLLDMMVRKWLRPNMITFSTLIHGLSLKPDAGLYGKIIPGFCDKCKFQDGANSLDEMILEGICPNRLTWSIHVRIHNAVVQGLASHGEINRAYQLYLSMRARGISDDASTFRDIDKAARVFEDMVHDGCALDKETWKAVVEGFVHWEKGKKAANLCGN